MTIPSTTICGRPPKLTISTTRNSGMGEEAASRKNVSSMESFASVKVS
jgi:hypothetical protein